METTVSSKYQVVIPKIIRERLDLKAQQKLIVMEKGGILYLVPKRPIGEFRGAAPRVAVEDYREKTERMG